MSQYVFFYFNKPICIKKNISLARNPKDLDKFNYILLITGSVQVRLVVS